MLTCIACSKQQLQDAGEDTPRSTKPNGKSLTSQIKDVVWRLSGASRQSKIEGSRRAQLYRSYDDELVEVDASGKDQNGRSGGDEDHCPFPPPIKTGGSRSTTVEDPAPKEWVAQVEPGVHVTFLALPQGGNDLKRIRFSREVFNKLQAQRWWGENYDRIVELYNVRRFSRQALPTPPRSEDERDVSSSSYSRRESPGRPPSYCSPKPLTTEHFFHHYRDGGPPALLRGDGSSLDASRTTTSSRDEASASNASDMVEVTEWVEEDEPGVYVTIRQMADGTRDLRRVRFSRDRFGEVNAKLWWEENRERIHSQYL